MATVGGLKEDGLTVSKWGYFSDIVTGPFVPFNAYSENKDFFKKRNGMLPYVTRDSECLFRYSSLLKSWPSTTLLLYSTSIIIKHITNQMDQKRLHKSQVRES